MQKTTRNTCKIANKFMTEASREINLQKQRSHMTSVAKEKAARSVHSMADVIAFWRIYYSLQIQGSG